MAKKTINLRFAWVMFALITLSTSVFSKKIYAGEQYYVGISIAEANLPRSMAGYAKLEDRCDLIYPSVVNINCKNSRFKGDSSPFTISFGKSNYVSDLYSYGTEIWYTEGYKASVDTNIIGSTSNQIQSLNLSVTQNQHLLRIAKARAIGLSFMPELRLDRNTKAYLNIGAGYGCGTLDVTVPRFEIKGYPVSVHTDKCSPLAKLGVGLTYKFSPALTLTAEYGQMGLPLVKNKNMQYWQFGLRGYLAQ